jgi:hypothetical protein
MAASFSGTRNCLISVQIEVFKRNVLPQPSYEMSRWRHYTKKLALISIERLFSNGCSRMD